MDNDEIRISDLLYTVFKHLWIFFMIRALSM